MTFFANSGLRFPNLAHPTQEAGTRALEGAGEIWHFLSGIENLTGDAPGELQMHKSNAIGSLEKALSIYKSVIENVTPTYVSLSPVEVELIGDYGRYYGEHPYYGQPEYLRWNLNIKELYLELIRRVELLIGQLRSLEITTNPPNMLQPVFSIMKQWEMIALIGRIIAVVNRQSESATK